MIWIIWDSNFCSSSSCAAYFLPIPLLTICITSYQVLHLFRHCHEKQSYDIAWLELADTSNCKVFAAAAAAAAPQTLNLLA